MVEAAGEELVEERLFQFVGQRQQPLLLLHRPLYQSQHSRYLPWFGSFVWKVIALLICHFTVQSWHADITENAFQVDMREKVIEEFDIKLCVRWHNEKSCVNRTERVSRKVDVACRTFPSDNNARRGNKRLVVPTDNPVRSKDREIPRNSFVLWQTPAVIER